MQDDFLPRALLPFLPDYSPHPDGSLSLHHGINLRKFVRGSFRLMPLGTTSWHPCGSLDHRSFSCSLPCCWSEALNPDPGPAACPAVLPA